jgi:uncharacterized repeat protein (TIGR03803 family)
MHVLINFVGNGHPKGNLQVGAGGVLFGTTSGVINGNGELGTVFELLPPSPGQTAWSRVVLHKFTDGRIGANPQVGVVTDPSGALYGTTNPTSVNFKFYPGVVYRLTPPSGGQTDWSYTILAKIPEAYYPNGQLLLASDGTLYGTATENPQSKCVCGIVYSVTPPAQGQQWVFNQLYAFQGGTDGSYPESGLIADASGSLYGTTTQGGAENAGTVFKLSPPMSGQSAWTETQLYAFQGGQSDGATPLGNLAWGENGVLYGTASQGGPSGAGMVFQLSPPGGGSGNWTETPLAFFPGESGSNPAAGVIVGSDASLYGTVQGGGKHGGGVYELRPPHRGENTWTLHNLHSFGPGLTAPSTPLGGVVAGSDDLLFGTTAYGGRHGQGTVFSLSY